LDVIDVVSDAENDEGVSQEILELMPTSAMSKLSGGREDSVLTEQTSSSQNASQELEVFFLLRERRRRIKVFLDNVESLRFTPLISSEPRPPMARRKKFLDLDGRLGGIVGGEL
jgi:hypothetical protein